MSPSIDTVTLAYFIGSVGILAEWHAYSLKCGHGFRRWSAIGAVLWAFQYCLLNAWTAGLTMGTTALRTLSSSQIKKRSGKDRAALGFILFFLTLTVFSWQGWISLLPAFAVINTTLALYFFENRNMRIVLLFSSLAWIANDCYWHAWPALLAESIAMLINLRTIRILNNLNH